MMVPGWAPFVSNVPIPAAIDGNVGATAFLGGVSLRPQERIDIPRSRGAGRGKEVESPVPFFATAIQPRITPVATKVIDVLDDRKRNDVTCGSPSVHAFQKTNDERVKDRFSMWEQCRAHIDLVENTINDSAAENPFDHMQHIILEQKQDFICRSQHHESAKLVPQTMTPFLGGYNLEDVTPANMVIMQNLKRSINEMEESEALMMNHLIAFIIWRCLQVPAAAEGLAIVMRTHGYKPTRKTDNQIAIAFGIWSTCSSLRSDFEALKVHNLKAQSEFEAAALLNIMGLQHDAAGTAIERGDEPMDEDLDLMDPLNEIP